MKATLCTFTIDHYYEVFNLWQKCEGIGLSDADSKDNIEKFLHQNNGLSFIAKLDDHIAGALLVGNDGRRGYLHHLAVLPQYRSQGIGSALVEAAIENLKKIGIAKCHLFIFAGNQSGRVFWEKCGWHLREDLGVLSKNIE